MLHYTQAKPGVGKSPMNLIRNVYLAVSSTRKFDVLEIAGVPYVSKIKLLILFRHMSIFNISNS